MKRMRVVVTVLALASMLLGADPSPLSPDLALLTRIKTTMAQNLTRLPNYTCLETIERSQRLVPSRKYRLVDTLRLEVALVEGKELFAWPGSGQFEDKPLDEMVVGGASGTGSFGNFARSVFMSGVPHYRFLGEETRNGRSAVHFSYRVPRLQSGFSLRSGTQEGIAGYHGDFWVDARTLDLIRLEIEAEDIPANVPLKRAQTDLEYARVRISEQEFLLPHLSDMRLTDLHGSESRNLTWFTNCRQYAGESKLSFEDVDPAADMPKPITKLRLPGGMYFEAKLQDALDGKGLAIGDPVTAVVEKPVKRKGEVIVPKGALLIGRVAALGHQTGSIDYYALRFEFHTLRFENTQADLRLELVDVGPLISISRQPFGRSMRRDGAGTPGYPPDTFFVKSDPLRLPQGTRLTFRTLVKDKS